MQTESIYEKTKSFLRIYIKYIFKSLISIINLEKPSSRLIMIVFCSLFLTIFPISYIPLFSVFSKLGLYEFLGFEFYSSGMTRALNSFFELEFEASYNYNSLIFIFISVLVIIVILDIYRLLFNNNTNYIFKNKNSRNNDNNYK